MKQDAIVRSITFNASDITGAIYDPSINPLIVLRSNLRSISNLPEVFFWNVEDGDFLKSTMLKERSFECVEQTICPIVDFRRISAKPDIWVKESTSRVQNHRNLKRLIRDGAVLNLQHRISSADELNNMMEIHDEMWEGRGIKGHFTDERRKNFVSRLVKIGFPLISSTLKFSGKIIAYNLYFTWRNRLYFWNSGFDQKFANRGPGSALLLADLMSALANPQIQIFDFLRGEEEYKFVYANDSYYVKSWSESN